LGGFETFTDDNIYLALGGIDRSFHHELYHQAMDYHNDFSSWQKLRKWQDKYYTRNELDKKVPWFARNYGKENVAEDQATVAEELTTNFRRICKRIQKDKILKEKVKLVLKAYETLSEWKMNKDFWEEKFKIECWDLIE